MSDLVRTSVPSSNHSQSFNAVDKRTESIASALLTYLSESTSAHAPTLAALAHKLNLSASRLQHIIKQETGISFTQHIKILRLQRARKLLQETCWTVKQVMIEVGFSDHSHFAKDYKKQFGESPTHTRCAALATRNTSVPCIPQPGTCNGSAKPGIHNGDGAVAGPVRSRQVHEPVPCNQRTADPAGALEPQA